MDDSRPYTTAQRLQEIMATRHLRQVDILRLAKPFEDEFGVVIRKNDLSQYIHDKSEPGQEKLYVLAAALGVSEPWLMGYDVDPDRGATPISSVEAYPTHTYTYIPAEISAGALTTVDGLTAADVQQVQLSDALMGKYAGRKDLIAMNVNGESMNNIIPNHSLIMVQRLHDVEELSDGDIVVFSQDNDDYSVKKFHDDQEARIYQFEPDSKDSSYRNINFRYEDAQDVYVIGKVVVYTVIVE